MANRHSTSRKAMAEKRLALRQELRSQRQKQLRALRQRATTARKTLRPHKRHVRARTWGIGIVILLALAALLLLVQCDDYSRPHTTSKIIRLPLTTPVQTPRPVRASLAESLRPELKIDGANQATWITLLLQQIRERALQLHTCFPQIKAALSLRWQFLVDPRSGQASDHTFTLLRGDAVLDNVTQACLAALLFETPFSLGDETSEFPQATVPQRIGVILEH